MRGWGIAAIAAVSLGLTSAVGWSSLTGTGPTAPGAAPTSRALLVLEAGSGAMTDAVRLSVSPTELAVAGDRIWIRSESDRAVSMVDLTNVDAARTAGLSEPPTSLAAHSDVAYVALGFTGDIATVADGSVQPPESAGDDVDGRLILAADEAGAWVATIDGRIRPPAGAIASPPEDVEGLPVRLAVDQGDAWVLTRTPDALVRISDGERAISSQLRGRSVDLAVRNGVAWVVTAGDDRLWGTSLEGGRVATTAVLPGSPTAVEIVGDIVWVALANPAAMIGIDARTLERRHFIPLAGVPSDVAVVGDRIVVALR